MIVFAAIMPHPPVSIPGIGSVDDLKKLSKTLNAFENLRIGLEAADPDTIIIISPHGHLEPYAFVINSDSDLRGSFAEFGLDDVYEYKNNVEIADKIDYVCLMNEMPVLLRGDYHLTKNIKPKVVHLSFSLMDYTRHYRYGEIIQKIIDSKSDERIAVIASADLSHKLTHDSPVGYSSNAEAFDHNVLRFLGSGDLVSLMNMEPDAITEAAECGLRSIIVLLGILHEKNFNFELLSYEAPFGIGHLTARLL